jgi:hypothetical protein
MYMLVALREGKRVECVGGFTSRRDAQREARRLNALPSQWRSPDGRVYHRPCWEVVMDHVTSGDPDRR